MPISTRALNPPSVLAGSLIRFFLSARTIMPAHYPRTCVASTCGLAALSVSTSSSSSPPSSSFSSCSECALSALSHSRSFPLFLTREMPVVRWVHGRTDRGRRQGRGWPGKEPLVMIRPLTLTPWLGSGREPVASQPQIESFDTREPAPQSSNLIFRLSASDARSLYDLPRVIRRSRN